MISESEGSTVGLDVTIATLRRFVAAEIEMLALPRLSGEEHPIFDRLVGLIAKP